MSLRRIGRRLLLPPVVLLLVLTPASAVFLVYSMVTLGQDSLPAILSYVLAFYVLTAWCLRLPSLVRSVRNFRQRNRYARRWLEDARIRVRMSLYGSLLLNGFYAAFQLALGFYHASFWYHSMAVYYLLLAIMRLRLAAHTRRYGPGEQMHRELILYRACGVIFLIMNLALSLMVFFMVYWGRTFHHHEITTIAMAAYTFTSLTMAIVTSVKYRRYNSPVYSATKAIGLAAAGVSMLTLESTMLTTFGGEDMAEETRRLFLALSGAAVVIFIVSMAVYMIAQGNKKLKQSQTEKERSYGKRRK